MSLSWGNWAKQQLANVAGTQEPHYGSKALNSVANQTSEVTHTIASKNDIKWITPATTCVETQTFYLMADSGHIGVVQVIYSNVMNLHTTCQFSVKVFHTTASLPPLWKTQPLENHRFGDGKFSFHADNCDLELSPDGNSFHIRSDVCPDAVVDLKIQRVSPGVMIGKDGTTTFGIDPAKPSGCIRHVFWPRCLTSGSITTQAGSINFAGKSVFIHALQGMKPHHAAASWNFATCTSANYSVIMMEFTTPESYGNTVVNVGAVASDDEIIVAGCENKVTVLKTIRDNQTDWKPPSAIRYEWSGRTNTDRVVNVSVQGNLGPHLDRVDVLKEVPKFIKNLMGGVAGTYPYIYQYAAKLPLKVNIGDDLPKNEEGILFAEATFISSPDRLYRPNIPVTPRKILRGRRSARPITGAHTRLRDSSGEALS